MAKKANTTKKKTVRGSAKVSVGSTRKAAVKTSRKPVMAPVATKQVLKPAGKIKSPLAKGDLEQFKQMLLEKRRALIGDMNGIEAEALRTNRQDGSGDLSNMPTHPADIGTDNFEQEFTLGLLESERTLLSEINLALDRIASGQYGVCMGTGQFIGLPRLKARPWAKYCIEYAKLLEKGLVQPHDEHKNDDEDGAQDEPEDEDEPVEEEGEE